MPTNEHHRTTTSIPGLRRSYEVDDARIILPDSRSAAPNTDGMVQLRAARLRFFEERMNAEIAALRLSTIYALRRQQVDQLIALGRDIFAHMQQNAGNAFIVDGLETAFYDWLQESRATIRHAATRSW